MCSDLLDNLSCANATDTFSCLVDVDVDTLQSANNELSLSDFFGLYTFVPIVDGEFVQESPTKAILAGKLNGVRTHRASIVLYPYFFFLNLGSSVNSKQCV